MSHTIPRTLAFFILAANAVATCHAQIGPGMAAGPPPLTPFPAPTPHFTIGQGMPNPLGPGDYILGDPANPLSVSYDPAAGPFEKWLAPRPDQNQDGTVDIGDFLSFLANPILNLHEHLIVGPGAAWTDWHEQILTPDWAWGNAQIMTPGPPPGPTNLVVQNSGTAVDFFFDPIQPGTPVDVWKQLFFTGVATQQMQDDFLQGNLMIRVAEYPTSVPEPATCLLIVSGCLGLAFALQRRVRD